MMEADDAGHNDQWREAAKALRKPGWDVRGGLDRDITECHLCIVQPSVHGVGLRHTTVECGAVVRAVTALLLSGTRVASKARVEARELFDARSGLSRGLGALRGEALAATPREWAAGRDARVEQRGVEQRLMRADVEPAQVRWCSRSVWKRYVRVRGRMRAVAMDDEVWLSSHISLWRAAVFARRWLQGFRTRRFSSLLAMADAGCTVAEMGEGMAATVRDSVAVRYHCGRLVDDARRRVRVLVCGLFHRLAGERSRVEREERAARAKSKKRKRKQRGRGRQGARRAKRGKAREREVEDFWRRVAAADMPDYNGSYFDLAPWRTSVLMPSYSGGRLWAEGGQSGCAGQVGVRRAVSRDASGSGFATRSQRLEVLADAAGIDRGVQERVGLRGGKRRRLEEGGDTSGVT